MKTNTRLRQTAVTVAIWISIFVVPISGAEVQPQPTPHKAFDAILREYVNDGVVDYKGLKRDEGLLDRYLGELDSADPSSMDRNEKLAFWINAYNAFTLKLILNYYPGIESIKDIPSSKRWNASIWSVDGEMRSLDQIEHKILRKMDEPRIHFAIVCASISCPDLLSKAYFPESLDEQLDEAASGFLYDSAKGARTVDEEGMLWGTNHTLYLSSIFDWFEGDFEKASGSVVDFVLPYLPETMKGFVDAHRDDLKVRNLDYDWRLNGS